MRVGGIAGCIALLASCYAPSVTEDVACPTGACPAPLVCDPVTVTCVRAATSPDGGAEPDAPGDAGPDASVTCDPGYRVEGTSCVDVDECAEQTDNCDANAACGNAPGSFTCACNPGHAGSGQACARVCSKVLIYDDCTSPDADCETIPEALFADNAAMGLGMEVLYGGVKDQAAFRNLFDAGGFEVLILEASLSDLDTATATRVASWVDGGGRAIVSFWDLDNTTAGQTIRTALQVSTTGEITTPRDVHRDPAASFNPFSKLETLPAPLVFTHLMVDDGDELTLAGNGFIAARHTSATGPGAIAVTRNNRAITMGFVPVGLVFQGPRDADSDGKPDVQELYTNLLGYLCGY